METKKIRFTTGILVLMIFITMPYLLKSQVVTVDKVTFGTPACALPASMTTPGSSSDWWPDNGTLFPSVPASSGYAGASGSCNLVAQDGNDLSGTTETLTYTVSTAAYNNTTLIWGAWKNSASFPAMTLEYSTDGSTYTSIGGWSDVAANSTWALINSGTAITLPAACNNVIKLYLRWRWTDDGSIANPTYAFDDITISGTINTFFSKSSGNLDQLSSWTVNYDGSAGTAPANFTDNGITYEIVNNASATIGANWVVSGTGSKVRVGDVTSNPAINFTIPAGFTFTGTVDVAKTATLTIQNTTIPTFGTLYTNSTVNYAAAGAQNVTNTTYYNLTISGSGTKTLPTTANTTVNGTLNISAGDLALANSALRNLTLNGPITGSGTMTGGANMSLFIAGTGAFGTLTFTGGANTLRRFLISRSGATYTMTLGSDLTVNTSLLDTSGILSLNGRTLNVTGSSTLPGATNSGKIKGSSTSSLNFATISSGSLMMDQTSSATKSLSVLTVNTGTTTLTIGNTLNIVDSLVPTSGTVASGGNLVLLADQTTVGHTGRIGVVLGSITGNIISQVYHKPNTNNTDWRNLGVAGISNATFSSWNSQFPMTCPTCPSTSAGGQPFSSITMYKESNESYPDITYGNTITPGVGYWVYLGNSSPGTASPPILISVTGTAQTGNVTAALTASDPGAMKGYNLVANPYPSPISFTKLQANNSIDNSWYTYSPAYGANAAYVGGISTPAYAYGGTGIDATIPAGMGFFVHANAATTLTFIESLKTSGSNEVLLRESGPSSTQSQMTYFRMQASNSTIMNEAVVRFDPNATTGFDGNYDLPLMAPGTPGWLQISSSSLGKAYTVNGLPDLTQNYSIPVTITCATTGQYQFNAVDLQNMPQGACLILHDKYTNTDHNLRQGGFSFTLTDTETVARFVLNVTVAPLQISTSVNPATCSNKNNARITAVGNNAGPWNYTWRNSGGSIIKASPNKTTADTLANLNNGAYSVDVNTVGSCDNATKSFTLVAPAAPVSAFTPSSTQVNTGTNITFANNSSNANTYWWTFGDGNTSNIQNPVYAYSTQGVYTVTLYAINTTCGDTVKSTQTITVQSAAGIASVNATDEIFVSRDQNGAYIKFNYSAQSKVNVNVYDALGQLLMANTGISVSNDKIYLNLDNAKDQMVFISITNLDKNTQITKRIYNN